MGSDTDISPTVTQSAVGPDGVAEDFECARCGYNLRGLTDPRCPECGLTYTWDELLDPTRRPHPYLFEHHASRRPVHSFVRTAMVSLRPQRFWRTLSLMHWCHRRRLGVFSLLSALLYYVGTLALFGLAVLFNILFFPSAGLRMGGLRLDVLIWMFLAVFSTPLIIQWATIGALLVFQQSLMHWRIRSYHVVRCGVYSGTGLLAGVLLSGFVWLLLLLGVLAWPAVLPNAAVLVGPIAPLVALFNWWRSLWLAYRNYLKIRRPLGMLVASQIIAALVVIDLFALLIWY